MLMLARKYVRIHASGNQALQSRDSTIDWGARVFHKNLEFQKMSI
jgi:hypothetical protein